MYNNSIVVINLIPGLDSEYDTMNIPHPYQRAEGASMPQVGLID